MILIHLNKFELSMRKHHDIICCVYFEVFWIPKCIAFFVWTRHEIKISLFQVSLTIFVHILANNFAPIWWMLVDFSFYFILYVGKWPTPYNTWKFELHGHTRGQYSRLILSGGRLERPKYKLKSHSAMCHYFIKKKQNPQVLCTNLVHGK